MAEDAEELREEVAAALRGKYPSVDVRPSYRAADAVVPVVASKLGQLRAERDALKAELAEARATIAASSTARDLLRETLAEHGQGALVAALEESGRELAEARATIERVRELRERIAETNGGELDGQRVLKALDAALDASQRPEDTREPAPKMRAVSVASPGNDGFRYEPEDTREETP